MNKNEFQKYLYDHIPVTEKMGFEVLDYSAESIRIKAALDININHRFSAFGGSISSLLIMAGWSYLRLLVEEFEEIPTIVIQNSSVNYYKPIVNDFIAEVEFLPEAALEKMHKQFHRFGKARLQVKTLIKDDEDKELLADFTGSYVLVKH